MQHKQPTFQVQPVSGVLLQQRVNEMLGLGRKVIRQIVVACNDAFQCVLNASRVERWSSNEHRVEHTAYAEDVRLKSVWPSRSYFSIQANNDDI